LGRRRLGKGEHVKKLLMVVLVVGVIAFVAKMVSDQA
jgi:hypothetical protein